MRRGVPFGRDDDEDRGLLFVAYQANIQRGFMKQQTGNILFFPGQDTIRKLMVHGLVRLGQQSHISAKGSS